MNQWWQLAIAGAVVAFLDLVSGVEYLPFGWGRLFAYLGLAAVPTLVIQYNDYQKSETKPTTGEFIFAFCTGMLMVLITAWIITDTLRWVF